MQRHLPVKGIQFLLGESSWDGFSQAPFQAFNKECLTFIEQLSASLLAQAGSYPNLASLGFFLRPSSITKQQQRLGRSLNGTPRGLAFHLSPSNVSTVAVFSCLSSLLSGCPAIVRINSHLTEEQLALFALLETVLKQHPTIATRVRLIQYAHSDQLNQTFSAIAKTRILWGGDHTLALFDAYKRAPDCEDLRFADRRSLAVIDLDYWFKLAVVDQQIQLKQLAGDIVSYQQLACSSPVLILSCGERQHLPDFQAALSLALTSQEPLFPDALEQEIALQQLLINGSDLGLERYSVWNWLELSHKSYSSSLKPSHGNLLFKHMAQTELAAFQFDFKPQTCVMLTDERLRKRIPDFITADRYVRPSQALLHEWIWDGLDLLKLQISDV